MIALETAILVAVGGFIGVGYLAYNRQVGLLIKLLELLRVVEDNQYNLKGEASLHLRELGNRLGDVTKDIGVLAREFQDINSQHNAFVAANETTKQNSELLSKLANAEYKLAALHERQQGLMEELKDCYKKKE